MAASAAHTVSLSSAWKLHDSSPELCHQERERKKNSFSFRGLLFWRRFFRRSRPFMQRDASKWPRSLQWSSAAPWLKMNFLLRCRSAPSPCVGTKKQRSSRFSFFVLFLGLFLSLLAWTKLHDVVHRLISACSFLRFSACYQLFIALELLSNWVSFMSDLLLQNNWAVVKKENTVRLQITK